MRLCVRKLIAARTDKYEHFRSHKSISFKIIATGVEPKEDREIIEAKYALINSSTHWNPSPTQHRTLAKLVHEHQH